MNTGDSMYITPFTRHSFATRGEAKENGLILALTYGGQLTGDIQQELSALSVELGSNYALDFSSYESASAELLIYHRKISNFTLMELSKNTSISINNLKLFENGSKLPSFFELKQLANALTVNIRDLLPNDKTENKVILKYYNEGRTWSYPEDNDSYLFHELASTSTLPFSKSFEIQVNDSNNSELDLKSGLHQYMYNVGINPIVLTWELNNEIFTKSINPNDSLYLKPFIKHNFRGNGKLLVLRVGGKIAGDSQRELSIVGKKNAERAISESLLWFDPKGKN
jgi:methylphosphonate synthase